MALLILQNWPNMLVHKQLLQFLHNSFDTCHTLISGVVDVYGAIFLRVSMVIVELWPFKTVKNRQKMSIHVTSLVSNPFILYFPQI